MNYYKEIKDQILNNEAYERIKDYSKERHRVLTYFEIGRLLHEAGKHYGESIIEKYAEKLKIEINKKYNKRTLFRMRQFYVIFSNTKVSPAGTQLTWSHYRALLSIKDKEEINYYIQIAANNHLTKNELEKKIKSKEYQRLDVKTRKKIESNRKIDIKEYVPNPIIIKNNKSILKITEKMLMNLILEDIMSFMKELGIGYSFIDREYKIKIDDRYNYIDLLLYNIKYKCYVVVELKVTEFKSEYIGQILKYMNYIDKNLKTINEDKTIGIIICKKNNHFYMEYCSDERVISREYKLIQ